MNNQMPATSSRKYVYCPEKGLRCIVPVAASVTIFLSGTCIIIAVIALIVDPTHYTGLDDLPFVVKLTVIFSMLTLVFNMAVYACLMLLLSADITLNYSELQYLVLKRWRLSISREELLYCKILRTDDFLGNELTRGPKYAIHIPSLPIFFNFVGYAYRVGFKPVLPFTSLHDNHRDLLRRLMELSDYHPTPRP